MPDETGLDTSITPVGWQDSGRGADRPTTKRRKKKAPDQADAPNATPRPQPAEGVGTRIDVVA
jgi:hypothetical protein